MYAMALWTLTLCQCATAPEVVRVVTLQPGDAVRIVYRDPAQGLFLTLQNEAIETAEALYSRGTANPFIKVARNEDLQGLLDALATYGFFQAARRTAPDSNRPALVVEINKQMLTWERQRAAQATAQDLQDFISSFGYFSFVYNNTEAFHAGRITGQDMERQKQALQRQGQRIQAGAIKMDRK